MARKVYDTLSYEECKRLMEGIIGRRRGRVQLAPNTYLEEGDGYAATVRGSYWVRFHSTYILGFYPDGRVMYASGGYRTATTKERLNRFGPFGVYQKRREWYIQAPGGDVPFLDGWMYEPDQVLRALRADDSPAGRAALHDYLEEKKAAV
jgi:hypothetical protein